MELLYAIQNELGYASIKNAAGNYIKATPDSITAALASATIPDDFRISMVNPPGAESYPIAGVTWILVYEHPHDAAKARELVAFLTWAETEGQKMARDLNFAPLSDNLRSQVVAEIKKISAGR